jgi:hypothetical protein
MIALWALLLMVVGQWWVIWKLADRIERMEDLLLDMPSAPRSEP